MRHSLLGGMLLVLVLTVGCASNPPPPTATDNRVTYQKYSYLQNDMSIDECNRIMGSAGTLKNESHYPGFLYVPGVDTQIYTWGGVEQFSVLQPPYIMVSFNNGKLYSKTQVGLHP